MARIKYQPSTRVKQFNPIQLSKEGITQMRRDSDRMIQGLQNNFQAEKEQQARDRAAMQENAALEEDRIKRDREIELENLKNEQTALSQQAKIDVQQDKFDADAQNTFFETIVDFSKTAMAKAAENHANMIKDQTKIANAIPIDHMVQAEVDKYQDIETNVQVAGGMRLDAEHLENAVETGEQPSETYRAVIGNPGHGDVQKRVIEQRVMKAAFPQIIGKALSGTEAIYDDGAGNKFAGIQAQEDPALMGILSAQVERDLYKNMGVNTAEPGRFVEAMTDIQKQKAALQNQANTKHINNSKVVLEQQAVDHASANTTQGYTIAFHKRKMLSLEKAHTGQQNSIGDHTTDLEALDRVDLLGDGRRYSQVWPKRWEAGLVQRRASETKAIKANIAFRKAQQDQFELDNIDTIRAAFDQNPTQAFRAAQEQAHYQGLTVSARVKGIHTAAIADKKDQELSVLQTKLRFSSLDESYVNSIQDPTVRKQGITALAQQEEQKYGPAALGIKKGFRATARKLTNINPNEGNDSPQTFLVQARLESEYLKQLEITQDPIAANAKVNEMIDKAAAGDKNSPFYTETGTNNRLVFTNIETVDTDLLERNMMIDKRMSTFGAGVASQPFVLATSEEMDATMISAQNVLGKVTYPLGVLRTAEKFGLKPSEVFNAQRQANNLVTGENKPLLTPSMGTDIVDALTPANRRLLKAAQEFNNYSMGQRVTASATGTLQNNVRRSMGGDAIRQRSALQEVAGELGVDPIDLATIIGFETGGTYDPGQVGGEGGNYSGLIQFGGPERDAYGVTPGMTFEEQLRGPVLNFFKDRFTKAGMSTQGASLEDLYTTVLAGNPAANRNAEDSFGTSALSGVSRMGPHREAAIKRFGF